MDTERVTWFTGKQLADLNKMKGWQSAVIRLKGEYQTIELNAGGLDGLSFSRDLRVGADLGNFDFVIMYACQGDTTWQYFIQGLKPADHVVFNLRTNGSQAMKERGLEVYELRAQVKRYKSDGKTLRAVYGVTVHREHRIIDNA